MNPETLITQTQHWLKSVVVECNFCPFAQRELERESIRFVISEKPQIDSCLQKVFDECVYLDEHTDTETTLLIFSGALSDFENYLDFVDMAEQLLVQQDYEGIYQLASFHPNYCFSGTETDDAANYTNRSPYPMLHLIRESSLKMALENYPDAEKVPERNIAFARAEGIDVMKARLDRCYEKTKHE